MIHAIRTVTVGDNESIIDKPIILYRGDREVEIEFTLLGNDFRFSEDGNVIKSTNASHGQLVLNTPSGENMFSEVSKCHDGNVVFIITKEMIDEFIEVGFYSFQIRLYDGAEMKSRMTIPPVLNGIDIRNPIAAEDETNVVDQGIVDYARIFKDQSNEELPTFDWTGAYNKTEWMHHDVITENKMNKIEDALYSINANVKESDVVMLNALDQFKKDADAYVEEHMAEVEQDVEEFERTLNTGVEKFKVDTNAAMTAHKNEVSEAIDEFSGEIESVNSQLAHIKSFTINVKDYGAKGDGITDDTIAIKKAIEEAELLINDRLTDGAIVFFPQGKYVVSDTLNITKSGINLKGESISTTIKDTGSTNILIKFNGDLTIYRSGLSNLTISSNSQQKNLILIDGVINSIIENLVISNSYDCFNLKNAGKVYFNNIILTQDNTANISRYGFDITDGNDVHFTNIQIFANATPNLPGSMIIRACDGLYFSNSHWHGTVILLPINNKTLASVFFDNCYFDRGGSACLEIQGATTNPYRNFMFSNCYFREAKKGVSIIPTSVCELIQFTGCSFTQNTMDGVYIESQVKNITFNGCSFADNNTINDSYYGHIISNGNYVSINGCQFVRGGENGYGVKSAGSYNNITNNNFKNCNGDKLNISGSSNNVINNAGILKKKVGSAIIQAGQTEILVNHGLTGVTSEMIMVTPRSIVTTNYRIAWVDETSFRILINSTESNSTIFTYWIDANLYN
jgi:hypothetical protein